MRPEPVRRGGISRPAAWFALAATAALHAAVIAAVFVPSPAPVAPPGAERITQIRLLPAKAPAPPVLPPVTLVAPHTPQALLPSLVVATPAPPPATTQAAATEAPTGMPTSYRASATNAHRDDALRRYAALLYARIVAHKRAGRHRSGTAVARFELDGQGRLVSVTLFRSSGDPLLDAAALASIRAATPFPPPPPGIAGAALSFTIPFLFS